MMRFHRKAFALLALGAAISLSACDAVDRVTNVTETQPPAYSYNKGNAKKWSSWLRRISPTEGEVGMKLIDSEGGTLKVGGHSLIVPKRAVRHQTAFIMRVLPGENIHVELHAYRTVNGREVSEFAIPVKLVLSLADADPADYDKARVAYLIDGDINGDIDLVSGSTVDRRAQTITAWLHHFSNYAVCID